MPRDDKDDSQQDYERVSKMADRLKLKGKERNRYIHEHMTGLNYKMIPSYVRNDDDDDDSGGRFGLGRRRRERDDDDDYPF